MNYINLKDKVIVRLDKGEELFETLKNVCKLTKIKSAYIQGIGASDKFTVAFYNNEIKKYEEFNFDSHYEITSINGVVTKDINEYNLHIHATFADKFSNLIGGHLIKTYISVTCEVILTKINKILSRKLDENLCIYKLNI